MEEKQQERGSAINLVFIFFVVGSILFASFTGKMQAITDASFDSAKGAVTLAINLIGIMALWLGLMRVLEAGGFMYSLARLLRPIMSRLFSDVPPENPAMSAMILNISANMLGLGNAATPFGIRAMIALNKLNPIPGTATNAMCLFLAINTSSVALFPLGTIGVRAAANAKDPAAIWAPSFIATLVSTAVGVAAALWLARFSAAKDATSKDSAAEAIDEVAKYEDEDYSHLLVPTSLVAKIRAWGLFAVFMVAAALGIYHAESKAVFIKEQILSFWLMPGLMLAIILYGFGRGVRVYEAVTEGAKQGFEIAIRIIPFLVAILVAIGMFRASGAMELLSGYLLPLTQPLGMPAEVLPMALIRPLSGSGAFGVMSELVSRAPDSYEAFLASVMMGSTETTFYVLAVYFGAVGIVRIRHALVAALLADTAGIIASCLVSPLFY